MSTSAITPDPSTALQSQPLRWADGRSTLFLALGLTLFKIVYLMVWCPYDLIPDEAHYWEWSRRPALSYYSKGPGVAWTIGASTSIFGDAMWAVRLPAALASAVAMLALAKLATDASGGDRRVGFFAAAAFALAPGFQAISLLMTIDGPYVASWIVAAMAGWQVLVRGARGCSSASDERSPEATASRTGADLAWWALLGAALGVGFLYKYTILLLALGLLLFAFTHGRRTWRPSQWGGLVLSFVVFLVCIAPVFIWNHQHDWPTVRHLMGHMNVEGGDLPVKRQSYTPWWTAVFFITQIGLLGPTLMVLVLLGIRRSTDMVWLNRAYLLWCGLPVIVFYFVISFTREIEGNWPIAGYTSLLVLVAAGLVRELPRRAALLAQWRERRQSTSARGLKPGRRPDTLWQVMWHWTVGVGVVVGVFLCFLNLAAHLPVIGPKIPLRRVMGHQAHVAKVQQIMEQVRREQGVEPLILVDHYGRASLLAYYLSGNPSVFSASSRMGGRRSSYDFFPDTDLTDPSLRTRPAVLIGGQPEHWFKALAFDSIHPTEVSVWQVPVHVALNYGGPLRQAEGAYRTGSNDDAMDR